EDEAKLRLARIGFDEVIGVLDGGVAALADRPDLAQQASRLSVAAFDRAADGGDVQVVDVRNPGETALGTIPGSHTIPLAELRGAADTLDLSRPVVVYCAGGYRSSVGASLLRSLGAA